MNRRTFLQTAGSAALASRMAGQVNSLTTSVSTSLPVLNADGSIGLSGSVTLPPAQHSGIDHIIVVMMENRSFDHFLGWLPGADGRQFGSYLDKNGTPHPVHPLAPDYTGCGHPDPDHSYDPDRVAYDGGKMDGFLRAGSNDVYSIGYYNEADLPFYGPLARNFTVCDRYFASILGPTFPNRMFMWSAQTDRLDDSLTGSTLPTIFDRLAAANVSHTYYFNNLPYLALWGFKYLFSVSTFSDFLTHARAGTLPAVSFVDPNYTLIDDGTGNDDHPHADIRNGDAFLSQIYSAVASSRAWKNTVLIFTFDEWGGFYEHVPPPRVVAPNNVDPDNKGGVLLGFRVPAIVASPFTRHSGIFPQVSHVLFEHSSILKLIEWRWNLRPLTARDASGQIGNLAAIMNFATPNASAPVLPAPPPVFAFPCFQASLFSSSSTIRSTADTNAQQGDGSEWARFAQSSTVQEFLKHPRFRGRVKQ